MKPLEVLEQAVQQGASPDIFSHHKLWKLSALASHLPFLTDDAFDFFLLNLTHTHTCILLAFPTAGLQVCAYLST